MRLDLISVVDTC
jgi:hypothetical protein